MPICNRCIWRSRTAPFTSRACFRDDKTTRWMDGHVTGLRTIIITFIAPFVSLPQMFSLLRRTVLPGGILAGATLSAFQAYQHPEFMASNVSFYTYTTYFCGLAMLPCTQKSLYSLILLGSSWVNPPKTTKKAPVPPPPFSLVIDIPFLSCL